MPPRGRKPKKRDASKTEAAIETMKTEYGITDVEIIKKVLNNLLEEYGGGEEAWYFIELYTYQELLEGIIRYRDEQENNLSVNRAGGGDSLEGNSLRFKTVEMQDLENVAGSSTQRIDSSRVEYQGWKDIGLDKTSRREEISRSKDYMNTTDSGTSADQLITTAPQTGDLEIRPDSRRLLFISPCLSDIAPSKKHRWPCYGWIENDDEEDIDDFIDLKPAKPTMNRRISKWDLAPEDP